MSAATIARAERLLGYGFGLDLWVDRLVHAAEQRLRRDVSGESLWRRARELADAGASPDAARLGALLEAVDAQRLPDVVRREVEGPSDAEIDAEELATYLANLESIEREFWTETLPAAAREAAVEDATRAALLAQIEAGAREALAPFATAADADPLPTGAPTRRVAVPGFAPVEIPEDLEPRLELVLGAEEDVRREFRHYTPGERALYRAIVAAAKPLEREPFAAARFAARQVELARRRGRAAA